MFPVFFDGVVIPHFYHIMFCYPPFFQYVWWLYTVFTILLMLIYIYIPICFMVMPYVSHIFGLYYIIRHFWSQSFSYVWVIPIFLMVLRCSSLYFRWLYPYVWWLYHWLCPMVGSHPKVRQVLRRQPGAKLGGKSRLLMGKKTHRNTWKKSGKHMEN